MCSHISQLFLEAAEMLQVGRVGDDQGHRLGKVPRGDTQCLM